MAAPLRSRLVRAVEGGRHGSGDLPTGGDEPFAGRFAHPPRAVGEERHQERGRGLRRDCRGGSARVSPDEGIGIVEETQRAAQSLARGGGAKGLERRSADVRRRVRGQRRNVTPGQRPVAPEKPDGVEADDAARMPEQRDQPRGGSRGKAIELGRHLHDVVLALYERLDEPVDRPFVPHPETTERGDAGDAELRLPAPKGEDQDPSGLVLVFVRIAEPDAVERLVREPPVGRRLAELRHAVAQACAQTSAEHDATEQRPRADGARADDDEAGCRNHPPHLSAPRTG